MEPIKSYGTSKKLQNQGFLLAGLMLFFFVIGLLLLNKIIVMFLIFSILKFVIAGLNSTHKIIKIYDRHFEIKLGVMASSKLIKNENFRAINVEKKKILIDYITEDGTKKTVKMLLTALEQEDLVDFKNFLDSLQQNPLSIDSSSKEQEAENI